MKQIKEYITERLKISSKNEYKYVPNNKKELEKIIDELIEKKEHHVDLNIIDTRNITDMSFLFYEKDCDVDISEWNVSNVTNMHSMFAGNRIFNCDISKWDVSNVTDMNTMFCECYEFNQDLSQWDVSNVTDMLGMFYNCKNFNQDLTEWGSCISEKCIIKQMFGKCKSLKKIPDWAIL